MEKRARVRLPSLQTLTVEGRLRDSSRSRKGSREDGVTAPQAKEPERGREEEVMADSGLFVGFGLPVRGRERQALAVFNEALQYYGRLQQQGEIESFEPVFLEPHGGDLGGFILLRGDGEKLARVRASDEFLRLSARAGLIVDGFGVVMADLGERLQRQIGLYQEQLDELT
jgi:hypothetical protein